MNSQKCVISKQWVISQNPIYVLRAFPLQQDVYMTFPLSNELRRLFDLVRGTPPTKTTFLYKEVEGMCEWIARRLNCICRLPTAQEVAYAYGIRAPVYLYEDFVSVQQEAPSFLPRKPECVWCTWLNTPAGWGILFPTETQIEYFLGTAQDNDDSCGILTVILQEKVR